MLCIDTVGMVVIAEKGDEKFAFPWGFSFLFVMETINARLRYGVFMTAL